MLARMYNIRWELYDDGGTVCWLLIVFNVFCFVFFCHLLEEFAAGHLQLGLATLVVRNLL